MVIACAVIGVGAYHYGKNTSQEESITPAEPVSTPSSDETKTGDQETSSRQLHLETCLQAVERLPVLPSAGHYRHVLNMLFEVLIRDVLVKPVLSAGE